MKLPYTIAIQWSEEDGCYLVHLLQFTTQQFHTHSDTYQEALSNAQEVLELLVEEYQQDGKPLPQPKPLVTVSQVAQSVGCGSAIAFWVSGSLGVRSRQRCVALSLISKPLLPQHPPEVNVVQLSKVRILRNVKKKFDRFHFRVASYSQLLYLTSNAAFN